MPTMQPNFILIDWLVLCLYFLGMLVAGFYYSRKTRNSEDYMLGGRSMKPWMVGLSLFATLFSALTYLAAPGEMIRHGPMMTSGLIAFPFFYLVVGWILIPRIVALPVSSAYELLEKKLGLANRLFASLIFLFMRLIWMSMIIYMSAEKVIVPILNWPPSSVIYVCIVLGIITVIYTSMGGIRAVVFTDVVQSFVLFTGALVVIAVIIFKLGGIGAIFLESWPVEWDKPLVFRNSQNPDARTFFAAFIAYFSWYVCTAGSDQMAIQRYLSTRDVKAARRAFLITTVSNGVVLVCLCLVGLALFAFFQHFPEALHGEVSVEERPDTLFPLFITQVLPPGVRAAVITALLAAAMSSLSSGVNSSCLVIIEDFLVRMRRKHFNENYKLKLSRWISVIIGIVVIFLSTIVGKTPGNLTEQLFRTANLLVAPLFVPFFVCLFMSRPNRAGTFIGTVVSIVVAVVIAFWQNWTQLASIIMGQPDIAEIKGIGFLWVIPLSFICGVTTAVVISLAKKGSSDECFELDT